MHLRFLAGGLCLAGGLVFAHFAAEFEEQGRGHDLVEQCGTEQSSDDDDRSYRTREEVEDMKLKDSLERFQAELFDEKLLDDDKLLELMDRAKNVVDDAIQFGESAPYPDLDEATYPIFAEDIRERVSDG